MQPTFTQKQKKRFFLICAVLLICAIPCNVLAKDPGKIAELGSITVTAQKTEESLKDVPLSVSVFDDVSLEDKEIMSLNDLAYYVPNFYFADFGVASSASIRGISAEATTMSSAVALYVDGIPLSNSIGFNAILEDIERVEVLRGPQGTLWGKNAEAGVINVITKKPDNNFGGKLGLSYGEDNKQEVNLNLKTPIIKDKLYLGLSGRYFAKDGMMKHFESGKIVDDEKDYFAKAHLRATPTDRLEFSLIASKYKVDNGNLRQNSLNNENIKIFYGDLIGKKDINDDSYAFKIAYDFDSFLLESVTSYKELSEDILFDYDQSPQKIMHSSSIFEHKTLSEELKISGEYARLKWLAGVFGSTFDSETEFKFYSLNPMIEALGSYNDITEKNFGIFVHLNYALNSNLNLIGGIRYDHDEVSLNKNTFGLKGGKSFSNISPKLAVEYKINDDFMAYVTAAKGYKAGGFYALSTGGYPNTYKNESLWSYESGFKAELLDKKLLLNASIFYIDMKDKQMMTSVDEVITYISNAASASSYGFELDGNYLINKNLNIFASFGYSKAKFDEFKDAFGDYKGNYLPNAPEYNYALGATFRGLGGFYASADLRGYAKSYGDNANKFKQGAYEIVNTKIGYEWDSFDIYVYADNLFNKEYNYLISNKMVLLSDPREFGIKLTYRF